MGIRRVALLVAAFFCAAWFAATGAALAAPRDETPGDRCLTFDAATQGLGLATLPSPDCLQIRPGGELRPAADPGRCVARNSGSGALSLVDGLSGSCVTLDLVSRVEVVRNDATACLGVDRVGGVMRLAAKDSSDCLQANEETGRLAPAAFPDRCYGFDSTSGLLTMVGSTTVSTSCLRADPSTGQVVIPGGRQTSWGSSAFTLRPAVRYAFTTMPKVGVGTLIPSGTGSEVAAIIEEQDARGMDLDVTLMARSSRFWVEYTEGDATSAANEPVGGAQVVQVYHAASPRGIFGLNLGRTGAAVTLATEFKTYSFGYQPPVSLFRKESEDCKFGIYPDIFYGRSTVDYTGRMQSTSFPAIRTDTWQGVDEDRFGAGLHTVGAKRFGKIDGRFVLDLEVLRRSYEMSSMQSNVCGAPGCPQASTFDANVSDSGSGTTWGVKLLTGVTYEMTRSSSLGVEVGVRYLDETAVPVNPVLTIDFDGAPHLGAASLMRFAVGMLYRYRFGSPR